MAGVLVVSRGSGRVVGVTLDWRRGRMAAVMVRLTGHRVSRDGDPAIRRENSRDAGGPTGCPESRM
jgi:hypothetical protein